MVCLLYFSYIVFASVINEDKLSEMAWSVCGGTGAYLNKISSVHVHPMGEIKVITISLSFNVISCILFNSSPTGS